MYKLEVEIWNNFMISIFPCSSSDFYLWELFFLADLFVPELDHSSNLAHTKFWL